MNNKKQLRILYGIIYIIATLGVLVSGFLYYEYQAHPQGGITCSITGDGCDQVRASDYSSILGVDIPILGILFYVSVWGYAASRFFRNKVYDWERFVLMGVVLFGLLFSGYLTYLEAMVIHAWCQWCVASALLTVGLFIVVAILFNREHNIQTPYAD